MWWLVAFLVALATPVPSSPRVLPIVAEPEVWAAPVEEVHLPMILKQQPDAIEGADSTLYGYATPMKRAYRVPYFNWDARPRDCTNDNFWPLVRGQSVSPGMVDACDNGRRLLLIYNEPELTDYSATPEEAARFVRDWADRWSGPIACCGNYYHSTVHGDGLEWFLAFVAASDNAPPIDYIHMHVYALLTVDVDRLEAWRAVADTYGWPIIVTESGVFPDRDYLPEDVAAALPDFLATVEDVLRPTTLMWFSDYVPPWALGDVTAWHHFNLTEIDASLTVVGEAWEAYTGHKIDNDRQK